MSKLTSRSSRLVPFFRQHYKVLTSAVAYQLGWFLCVFTSTWLWALYLVFYTILHYSVISKSRVHWHFSIKIMVLGCLMDAFLTRSGVFTFSSTVIPLWLVAMWYMFSLSIPYAFGFLRGKYYLAALLGSVGAAGTYIGGSLFRADMTLMQPTALAFVFIALAWAIFFPHAYFQLKRMEDLNRS